MDMPRSGEFWKLFCLWGKWPVGGCLVGGTEGWREPCCHKQLSNKRTYVISFWPHIFQKWKCMGTFMVFLFYIFHFFLYSFFYFSLTWQNCWDASGFCSKQNRAFWLPKPNIEKFSDIYLKCSERLRNKSDLRLNNRFSQD